MLQSFTHHLIHFLTHPFTHLSPAPFHTLQPPSFPSIHPLPPFHALGWWGEETLDCLVERKLRKMRLDPLLDDGYAGDILSAVMKPRAAYLRLFPFCAPAALLVYQMASTPPCFLVYPRHTPSPLFDKLSTAILHRKDGVASNETGQSTYILFDWSPHPL